MDAPPEYSDVQSAVHGLRSAICGSTLIPMMLVRDLKAIIPRQFRNISSNVSVRFLLFWYLNPARIVSIVSLFEWHINYFACLYIEFTLKTMQYSYLLSIRHSSVAYNEVFWVWDVTVPLVQWSTILRSSCWNWFFAFYVRRCGLCVKDCVRERI